MITAILYGIVLPNDTVDGWRNPAGRWFIPLESHLIGGLEHFLLFPSYWE
jgi:hypothetical protein